MRKILLATLDFPPRVGGVGQYLLNIARFFNGKIAAIAPPMRGDEEFDSKEHFKVYRRPLLFQYFWPRHLKGFFILKGIFQREKAEILAINDVLPLGYPALFLKLFFKIPYFVFLHGLDFNLAKRNLWKKFWLRLILENSQFIVVNSNYLKGEVLKLVPFAKIETVYPIIGDLPVSGGALKQEIVGNHKLEGKKIVFSLGRLVGRKGFNELILAFKDVKKEIEDAVLLIAGSGPEEKALKILAENSKDIIFLGKISDEEKCVFYDLCDIFALPARETGGDIEGFGIVYLEAAHFGKPSVAGKVGGVSEAVLDGKTGILVDGKSAGEIAKAIIKLLKDDNLRREMGEKANKRVLEEFTTENQAAKIKDKI